jgi:hypothetical protein
VLQTDSEMFLEIVEGRGIEFSFFGEGEVLVVRVGVDFLLFFWFLRLLDRFWFLIFGKELIKIHA